MTRSPGSQQQTVLQEKARIARTLLARGLTVTQVAAQLNCSRQFVRKIAREEQLSSE
jgi:DNA invertase Pin-like site-specific DNA recombinase